MSGAGIKNEVYSPHTGETSISSMWKIPHVFFGHEHRYTGRR